jgi:hypothetical protein
MARRSKLLPTREYQSACKGEHSGIGDVAAQAQHIATTDQLQYNILIIRNLRITQPNFDQKHGILQFFTPKGQCFRWLFIREICLEGR